MQIIIILINFINFNINYYCTMFLCLILQIKIKHKKLWIFWNIFLPHKVPIQKLWIVLDSYLYSIAPVEIIAQDGMTSLDSS